MKILFFTDVHVHHAWLDRSVDCFSHVIDVVKKHNIDLIFYLGDLFEEKDKISNIARKVVKDFLDAVSIPVYLLVGNHDFRIKEVTTLEVFPNVIKEVTTFTFGGYTFVACPYGVEFSSPITTDFFLFHDVVKGLRLPNGYIFEKGVNLRNIEAKYYLSGHIHHPCTFQDVNYLGAPIERDFRDAVSTPTNVTKRGFYIFDTDTSKFTFVEHKSLKFLKVEVKSKSQFDKIYNQIMRNFISNGYPVVLWVDLLKKIDLPDFDRSVFENVIITTAISDEEVQPEVALNVDIKNILNKFLPNDVDDEFLQVGYSVYQKLGFDL